ncbi:MAG: hypothetical protein MJE77_38545 [Proteobacteria bacterium]|nr:hypothetical protein [Pseudomonadota bacterium]
MINPTGRRIEAVISVDGLDVIDGQAADVRKRGYVVPAHGELTVDGFRVSTREVATFRFSSVSNSYAGRKGVARNVGVIGVALFAEQSDPQLILADPARPADRRHDRRSPAHDRGYRGEMRSRDHRQHDGDGHSDFEVEAEQAPAAAGDSRTARGHSRAGSAPAVSSGADKIDSAPGSASTRLSRPGRASKAPDEASEDGYRWRRCCVKPKERPGLGTAFGERRGSTATWTRFVRANATVPTAIAELHYNDAAGLRAVGIPIGVIDDDEIATRESANPFPGSRFAEPPRR